MGEISSSVSMIGVPVLPGRGFVVEFSSMVSNAMAYSAC